jgi:hypothetical protein
MACVHADYAGEVLKVDDPTLFIVTTNEGGQIQAAVVYYQYQSEQHSKIKSVFKGSLADSNAEALLSLYEESKIVATTWKANLERRGSSVHRVERYRQRDLNSGYEDIGEERLHDLQAIDQRY